MKQNVNSMVLDLNFFTFNVQLRMLYYVLINLQLGVAKVVQSPLLPPTALATGQSIIFLYQNVVHLFVSYIR